MNDHPAHPATHLLHTTQWTGGTDIPMHDNEVDVLTPAGVA